MQGTNAKNGKLGGGPGQETYTIELIDWLMKKELRMVIGLIDWFTKKELWRDEERTKNLEEEIFLPLLVGIDILCNPLFI